MPARRRHRNSRGIIMKIWSYIEKHHDDLGVALFVIPVTLIGLLFSGLAYGVTLLLLG